MVDGAPLRGARSRLLASTLKGDGLYEARLVKALDAIEEFLASVRGAPRVEEDEELAREIEENVEELRGLGLA
ncbi:hypothetical protein [Thermofilum pendens]|uniref:Uncharacterized protein n=1 Tax=Thermofilum pendens (strain DSM 2475 / Hrk 5) TaxID=368408 RepID=A1RYJ5_THEPD|nr:hypothetical protein [Thermofilum pendens]ABL78275.1 hypothetical protein Tpen_0874 [Thermofilum pendens Hrk 5]